MASVFGEFLKSINNTKENLMENFPEYEKEYTPFLINRTLSYFSDCIVQANEMNKASELPARMQYDFLLNSIAKGKRFSKWNKKNELQSLDIIREYYGYSTKEALYALTALNDKQIEKIKKRLEKGGRK